uniref:Uncharacterized protein n=1 Tax=Candidatus Methanomethylicus mesodigestus TaxID=1867258 RepID=A0A7C3J4F7_9CREN
MRKIKIELCDNDGEQVTVSLSGHFSSERLISLLHLLDDNLYTKSPDNNGQTVIKTVKDKILDLIKNELSKIWFTGKDLSLLYVDKYGELIKQSTISTYLMRLYASGYLERKGNRSCWQYRLITNIQPSDGQIKEFVRSLQKE